MAQRGVHRKSPKMIELMRRLGLIPEDTAFNRRAQKYASRADHCNKMRAQAKERRVREKPTA